MQPWGLTAYFIDEVKAYDIAALFKRLVRVLEQITICSLTTNWRRLSNLILTLTNRICSVI